MTSDVPPLRARGRPPKSAADQQHLKNRIADATLVVFAEHGYHAMTVELILTQAGVSRPTFYKYFRSLEEPLALAAYPLHERLVSSIAQALRQDGDAVLAAIAACDAYVAWARSLGTLTRQLYAEFYEQSSPVARFRLQTILAIQDLVRDKLQQAGRPVPDAATLELFTTGIEFLTFRYLLHTSQNDLEWLSTRRAMMRLLLASFGTPQDLPLQQLLWQGVVPL